MARAVLTIGFSLAYVAGAMTTQATMSTEDALYQLKSKLPHQVVAVMKGLRRQHTARKTAFLETAANRGASNEAVDKKNVDEAREKLNEMVEETQEKLDKEEVECEASIRNQDAVLEETRGDIALYSSQATQANGDHIRAGSAINSLETTRGKVQEELAQSKADCTQVIGSLKNEIDIMVNDSAILQGIVEMVKCPKASFLQCTDAHGNTTTTFGNTDWQSQMAQLQSKKVQDKLQGALELGYHSGATKQVSTDGNEPGPEGKSCSLASNPNCGRLLDKFLEISGELDSDIAKTREHLASKEEQCKLEHENYEAQIGDISSRLENWGTSLAEAVDRVIQANEGERLKSIQKGELDVKFMETKSECKVNIETFTSEMCAMGKIRGELYRMSDSAKFIEDCSVGDWVYGECSKECMERPTDADGTQNLTRDVITIATLGAKCPPLKLVQVCNKIACPVDCITSEWSEWSGCSTKCGGGIRERIRSIKLHERFGGEPCGPASETETCNLQGCDKDCELGAWSKLSSMRCTKACGGGVKWSLRGVHKDLIGQGACPDPYSDQRYRLSTCNTWGCHALGDTLVCDSKVDVVIMLDGSGSLGTAGWAATQVMGQKLVKAFNSAIVTPSARVAVQLFSGPKTWSAYRQCIGKAYKRGWVWQRRGRWGWRWRWSWVWPKPIVAANMETDCGISWVTALTSQEGHFTADMADTAVKIAALTWPSASTLTSLALAQAEAELMYAREDSTKIVVVITDGVPMNPMMTSKASKKLKDVARLIWVPVTAGAPKEQLEDWASKPTDQNVVWVDDFKQLETPDVVTQIIAEVCPDAK